MGKKKKSDEQQSSFEEMLARLEEIAGELESGDLPLEKAIERYEEGVKCYRECHRILTSAEKKVEILTKNADGELTPEPFEDEDTEGSADEKDDNDADEDKGGKGGTLPF